MQVSLCADVSSTPENVVGTAGFKKKKNPQNNEQGDVSWGMGRH